MKKIKLTEADLTRIIEKVIKEQSIIADPDYKEDLTHDEFMAGIEKYCNKNTSGCPRRCKSDEELFSIISKWCKSIKK